MSIDLTINPIAIAAFVLTCLGCVQVFAAMFITNWWSVGSDGKTFYGVWSKFVCSPDGECESGSATELEGGQEALFISKIFATFTVFLSLVAVVMHIVYFVIRLALVRTLSIFMLGSAGLFGLLSIFVFLGFYHNLDLKSSSIGVAFYLFMIGAIVCLVAAAFTAWASVRKVTSVNFVDAPDDD